MSVLDPTEPQQAIVLVEAQAQTRRALDTVYALGNTEIRTIADHMQILIGEAMDGPESDAFRQLSDKAYELIHRVTHD